MVRLQDALRRYGAPQDMLGMIAGLFEGRRFYAKDCGVSSEPRQQASCISQGCTLRPLVFEVVICLVLLHDAVGALGLEGRREYERGVLADVVCADDTSLMGNGRLLIEYLHATGAARKRYGIESHWVKIQLL